MLAVVLLAAFVGLIFISCFSLSLIFYFRARRYATEHDNTDDVSTPVRTLVSLVVETCSTSLLVLLYPFGILGGGKAVKGEDRSHWIIMVHGYGHNRSAFYVLRRRLKKMGFENSWLMNLSSSFGPLEETAKDLAGEISRAFSYLPENSLTLIAHSMGGLVCRYYIQELGGHHKVAQLITLATPHRGTRQAELGFGESTRQMLPGSTFLKKLNDPAKSGLTRGTCIWSASDNVVIPRMSAALPGQEVYLLRYLGHNAMLFSGKVAKRIGELILRREGPETGLRLKEGKY